jgi:hypothetical protein
MKIAKIRNKNLLFITLEDRDCHILADRDIEQWVNTFGDLSKLSELIGAFNELQKHKIMLSCKKVYEMGATPYEGAPTLEECSKYSLEELPKDIVRNVLLKYFEEWETLK